MQIIDITLKKSIKKTKPEAFCHIHPYPHPQDNDLQFI
jgi:hypothetical protein